MKIATEANVIGALNELMEVWEERDVDAILSFFAPSPTVSLYGTGADEKRVGLDEIREQIDRDFSQSESLSCKLVWNLVGISGPVAWVASDVEIHFKAPNQDEMAFPARLTTVLQNYDGRWLCEHLHLSAAAAGQEEGESF